MHLSTLVSRGIYQPCSSLTATLEDSQPAEEVTLEGTGGTRVTGKRYRLKVR